MRGVDPWNNYILEEKDYRNIIEKYELIDFSEILDGIDNPHPFMKKGIVFAAEGNDKNELIEIISKPKHTCVIAGFDLAGKLHFGSKVVIDQVVYYQEKGAKCRIPLVDLEAVSARNVSLEKATEYRD